MADGDITLVGEDGTARGAASGDLWMPYIGNWSLRLVLTDADPPPSGRVTVSFHGLTLVGTVLRAGQAEALNTVTIVGGQGGLSTPIAPKMYDNQHAAQLVVSEILSAAGESLDESSTPAVLGQVLPQYPRLGDEPQHLLDTLCDVLSTPDQPVVWRVLPSGGVFFGQDPFTDLTATYTDGSTGLADPQYQLLRTDPAFTHMQVIAPVSLAVFPGTSFLLGRVGTVRYIDDGQSFVGRIYYFDAAGPGEDPVTAGLRAIVREETRGAAFHPCFTGRVVTQGASGLLDIDMDDVRLPPLTSIPYRVPYPGCSMAIRAGARVQVDFEGGDPRRAAARLYEPGDASKAVVLDGDQVDCGTFQTTAVQAGPVVTLTILWIPPGGGAPQTLGAIAATGSGTPGTVAVRGKAIGSAPLKFP